MHKRLISGSKGFTIVELLVVIVVIAILAAIATVAYNGVTHKARVSIVQQSLAQVNRAISVFKTASDSEDYPLTLESAGVNSSNGTAFQYTASNTGDKEYCVTATLDDVSMFYSSTTGSTSEGFCPGHGPSVYKTAAGWNSYPIPWSTSTTDHGYGLYYGAYYPSTLRAENSGSLTLFNPLAGSAAQGGVRTYFYCRNTSSNVISNTITGPTFSSFDTGSETQTINWSCPANSVLYAFGIGSTVPVSATNPDTVTTKSRMWFSPQSPNYKPSESFTPPNVAADPAGWANMPIPWSTGTDLGQGPYYGVYYENDTNKSLSATESGIFQLYNPYAQTRSQSGVRFYYWCKNATSGLVGSNSSVTFGGFASSTQTREIAWACPAGSKLFAATIGSTQTTTMFPNELSSKSRFWFSGESLSPYASYLESIRIKHGE